MEKRVFRIVSVCVIALMLTAMIVITSFSVAAFEPLDGEESTGSKTTMGPLDSREEGVSQTISYPDDYYSAVTYGPLDGEESEEESDVPTDPSQSVTDPSSSETVPSESSKTKHSNTNTSHQKPTETSASESSPSETQPSESQSSDQPSETSITGGDPTATTPTLPTLPSQSGTSETDPSASVKTPLYGDANDDGVVNMKDVLLMRKYLAEMPVTVCFENADVDASGTVNMKDVLSVRKYLAEIIDKLGPTA